MSPEEILQSHGVRPTGARKHILDIFLQNTSPLTAFDVSEHKAIKTTGIDPVTVYRTLERFVNKKILTKLEFLEGKFRYELSSHNHHHHAICQKCGTITDIEDCMDKDLERKVAQKTHFAITSHKLEFFGLCSKCH